MMVRVLHIFVILTHQWESNYDQQKKGCEFLLCKSSEKYLPQSLTELSFINRRLHVIAQIFRNDWNPNNSVMSRAVAKSLRDSNHKKILFLS